MEQSFQILEFDKIKRMLEENAYTEKAKEKIRELVPFLSETELVTNRRETSEARVILDKIGTPPAVTLKDMDKIILSADQGGCLSPEQLEYIEITLTAVKRLKNFLERSKGLELSLPYYETQLDSMEELREEIQHKIRNSKVDDFASSLLKDLRSEIERLDNKMRQKADGILKNNKECFSDSFVTLRSGRICLPVKKEYKFKINGSVIDKSSTGATLFIEPTAVAKLSEELSLFRMDEENEERRILYVLSAMAADYLEAFRQNAAVIEKLDFAFAKGKLSADMNAVEAMFNTEQKIEMKDGRHPFLEKESCVPLNFSMQKETQGIIITGPNTGGKTVAIKTVGLLSIMAQCGLHVPCKKADFAMHNQVLCDIGDGQNITENLSTFSAHIKNSLSIISKADKESLVIMDELGSGTDPTEGMGIAIAILEELRKSNCLFLITTHYPEVKAYTEKTPHVQNARMAFDKESLKPLYRLEIGEAGESCAFYIAKRLGMTDEMLHTASMAAYGEVSEELKKGNKNPQDRQMQRTNSYKTPVIQKKKESKIDSKRIDQYEIGDSVMIYPEQKIGIVCKKVDEKGMLQVQAKEKKIEINQKRVKLHVKADKLYPEDYDFSILFQSVEERKIRHQMQRKYTPDLEIRGSE